MTELEGEQVSYEARLQLIQNIEKAISDERKAMAEAKKEEEKEAIVSEGHQLSHISLLPV